MVDILNLSLEAVLYSLHCSQIMRFGLLELYSLDFKLLLPQIEDNILHRLGDGKFDILLGQFNMATFAAELVFKDLLYLAQHAFAQMLKVVGAEAIKMIGEF